MIPEEGGSVRVVVICLWTVHETKDKGPMIIVGSIIPSPNMLFRQGLLSWGTHCIPIKLHTLHWAHRRWVGFTR